MAITIYVYVELFSTVYLVAHYGGISMSTYSNEQLRDLLFELWRDGRSDNDRYNSVNSAEEKIQSIIEQATKAAEVRGRIDEQNRTELWQDGGIKVKSEDVYGNTIWVSQAQRLTQIPRSSQMRKTLALWIANKITPKHIRIGEKK